MWLFLLAPWAAFLTGVGQAVAREGPVSDFGVVSFAGMGVVVGAFTAIVWHLRPIRIE